MTFLWCFLFWSNTVCFFFTMFSLFFSRFFLLVCIFLVLRFVVCLIFFISIQNQFYLRALSSLFILTQSTPYHAVVFADFTLIVFLVSLRVWSFCFLSFLQVFSTLINMGNHWIDNCRRRYIGGRNTGLNNLAWKYGLAAITSEWGIILSMFIMLHRQQNHSISMHFFTIFFVFL